MCPPAPRQRTVLTRVAMFSAICVSTGKSAKAMLIHCAEQPVAISERQSGQITVREDLSHLSCS